MPKIISVYFNGTDDKNTIPGQGIITLAALLDRLTVKDDKNHFSMCVNGCGVETQDSRDLGGVFAFHLERQVLNIAKQVEEIINSTEEKVNLNIYGFGRGGAAAFLLSQQLKNISPNRLIINIAAFEPVTGNFITSVYGDMLLGTYSTLSAAVADLTDCKSLTNMLVLFTNQPLPDIAVNAPILPAFPTTCNTEIDVTPGYHKLAATFYKKGKSVLPVNDESAVVFQRIVEFMQKSGTSFNFHRLRLNSNLVYSDESKKDPVDQGLLNIYENLTKKTAMFDRSKNRSMHLQNTIFTAKSRKKYLNLYHQKLCHVEHVSDKDCALTVENRNPERINPQQRQAIQLMQLTFTLAMTWLIYNKYFNQSHIESHNHFRP